MRVPQSLISNISNVLAEEVVELEEKIVHAKEEVDGQLHEKEKGNGVGQEEEVAEGVALSFPRKGEKLVPLSENWKHPMNSQ